MLTRQTAQAGQPTVLVTGAAGGVARYLLSELGSAYTLRLTDRRPFPGGVIGDLSDADFARRVCSGADAVVHLAADADPDQPWQRLRDPNATALVNVLDGAVAAGVPRVVLASSLHAVGGHLDAGQAEIGEDVPPYPCCTYGALKVFAENIGHLYADLHRLRVVCLRLGGVRDRHAAGFPAGSADRTLSGSSPPHSPPTWSTASTTVSPLTRPGSGATIVPGTSWATSRSTTPPSTPTRCRTISPTDPRMTLTCARGFFT